jgi:hypothetical protein
LAGGRGGDKQDRVSDRYAVLWKFLRDRIMQKLVLLVQI